MFSDLAHVRKELSLRLSPLLPSLWKIEPNLVQPPTEYHSPLLTFEFKRFESTVDGRFLGYGQAAARIDLVLGSTMTADRTGEDDIDSIVLRLIRAIDVQPDMFWDSADKERLGDTGQWVWRIHALVLTATKERAT